MVVFMLSCSLLLFGTITGLLASPSASNHPHGGSRLHPRGLLGSGLGSLLSPGNPLGTPTSSYFNAQSLPPGPPPPYTPGDAPWTVSEAAYRSMIVCPGGLRGRGGVVLLVPPTGGNGQQVWLKSPYVQGLPRIGFATCWVDNPTISTGDIQFTSEYVAYAIKYLASQSGAPVSIITFSQGGLNAQWALTFWPSTQPLVRNMITISCPFHGSIISNFLCPAFNLVGGCLPAVFQLASNSKFIAALNAPMYGSGATALVPTTSIYSLQDELAPQVGRIPTSNLNGAVNIALQSICGISYVADHFMTVGDYTVYSIALNALLNGGTANPATLDRSICNQAGGLGYHAKSLANDVKYAVAGTIGNPRERVGSLLKTVTSLRVSVEPPLQMYVCSRGFATGCAADGFSGSPGSAPILSTLPQAIHGIGPTLGNVLGGLGRG